MIPLTPPYRPAIGESAQEFFATILRPDFTVFEWGSGGSTLWLAQRVAHVVTVENIPIWQLEVGRYAQQAGLDNIEYLLVCWEKGEPITDALLDAYTETILQFPLESFDLIFSDGWGEARRRCAPLADSRLKPGGWLVADDSGWNPVRTSIARYVEAGWRDVRKGGVVTCAWDGLPRKNVTAFLQKPED